MFFPKSPPTQTKPHYLSISRESLWPKLLCLSSDPGRPLWTKVGILTIKFYQKCLDRWPGRAITIGYFTRRRIRFEWNRSKRLFVTTLGRNWMTHTVWVIQYCSCVWVIIISLNFYFGGNFGNGGVKMNQYYIYKWQSDRIDLKWVILIFVIK